MLKTLLLWWHARATRHKMDRVFSRGADPYRYGQSPYELARLAAMRQALGRGPFRHALEVGCAEGAFTAMLAERAGRVTALDVSSIALARARARVQDPKVAWIEGDIRRWEPGGERFDAAILGDVLYYLDKPLVREQFRAACSKVADWIEPGGLLLLAHGFASAEERRVREGYRRRFEEAGLRLESERVVGEGEKDGRVCCLLSVLAKQP